VTHHLNIAFRLQLGTVESGKETFIHKFHLLLRQVLLILRLQVRSTFDRNLHLIMLNRWLSLGCVRHSGTVEAKSFNIQLQLLQVTRSSSTFYFWSEHLSVVFWKGVRFYQTPVMSVLQLCLSCLCLILDYLHYYSVTLWRKNWSDFLPEVSVDDHLKICGRWKTFYRVLS